MAEKEKEKHPVRILEDPITKRLTVVFIDRHGKVKQAAVKSHV